MGEAIAAYGAVLAPYRTVGLAGIDDLLRFEALEPLMSAAERAGLLEAYWKPLTEFQANRKVRLALGDMTACYDGSFYLTNVTIAGRHTFANFSPLANSYLMFWMRRRADGNPDLARRGLEMVRASLAAAASPPNPRRP